MKVKALIEHYHQALTQTYGSHLLPSHRRALDAMLACRQHCGEFGTQCVHCQTHQRWPLSCGHRSCPQCQHHLGQFWQDRQMQKLLPVTYFMVTFTLPKELRPLAWQYQTVIYEILFKAAHETLLTIGKNNHGMQLAMTAVLHTHTRTKDYHPHIHLVVPGGGLVQDRQGFAWKPITENYLINEFALARVFSGIFMRLLFEAAVPLPGGIPTQWVAHVRNVGRGKKAIAYLSRYLYRGVISENDILADDQGQVTFRYQDSKTRRLTKQTLAGECFLWKLLTHVLPRGFRRVRDYGFLHTNAKRLLKRIQLLLHVKLPEKSKEKTKMRCRQCTNPLQIEWILPQKIPMRFRFYNNDAGADALT